MSKKIVIIGLGTGGLYSSRAISRYDRNVMITIIEKRDYDMFSPCGLPYALEGKVDSFEALKHTVPTTKNIKKLISILIFVVMFGTINIALLITRDFE